MTTGCSWNGCRRMGIDQYSLTRTTLEDVYLGLTGGTPESAAEDDDEHHTSD